VRDDGRPVGLPLLGSARRRGVKGHPATAALLPHGGPGAVAAPTGLRAVYHRVGDPHVTDC